MGARALDRPREELARLGHRGLGLAAFAEPGARSRRELVARVLCRHHTPHPAAGESPGTDGWFARVAVG